MSNRVTIGDYSFTIDPESHPRFWRKAGKGNWEPETFAIFDRFIGEDTLFVDIGAWIGPTALYGVQRAKRCVAFEPDPVAFAELQKNVALNASAAWAERLSIEECAINKDGASFILGGSREGADSMSSALFPSRESQWTVRARRLQDVFADHRQSDQPVFVKIDIEGGEYDLLPTIPDLIADPGVTAYISFHPRMLRRSIEATAPGDAWKDPYIAHHLAVLESLPPEKSISLSSGVPIEKTALIERLQTHHKFPTELLISSAV